MKRDQKDSKREGVFLSHDVRGKISDKLGEHSYFDREAHGDEIFSKEKPVGVNYPIIISVLLCLFLAIRLFTLQVQEGFVNLRLAEGNRLRSTPIAAPRGIITDVDGNPLVVNSTVYQLVVQTDKLKSLDQVNPKIFKIVQMSKDEVRDKIKSNTDATDYSVLKDDINRDEALLLKSRLVSYGGFEIIPSYRRQYLDLSFSHILGFVGKVSKEEASTRPSLLASGYNGKSGLEKTYDDYLQGIPGQRRAEVDANGHLVRLLSQTDPALGNTVKTSIDKDLQLKVTEILQAQLNDLKTQGTVIIEDPRDGMIRAMVSLPDFDNTKFSAGLGQDEYKQITEDKSLPMFNRATSGTYPPGSTIKPFIASAALEDGVVSPSVAFETPASIKVGQWTFPDWKKHDGVTGVRRAIAESNNIFFFAIGGGWGPIQTGLGPERIKNGLEKFGFGNETGIDLSAEESGFIPTEEWKKSKTGENWYIGNTYNMSIGQGDLLVTPLQICNATSSIANGGKLFKPHLVTQILDQDGNKIKEFTESDSLIKNNIYSSETMQVVREGMRQTVESGSAYSVFGKSFPIDVAAKTGTAQFGNEGKTHAWFTSFAPYDNPQIAVTVIVEGAGDGFEYAAPIARDIYSWWAENRNK